MTSPSAVQKTPPGSPLPPREPSRSAEISNEARSRMPVASSSEAPLTGAATARFFYEKFKTAHKLTDEGQCDDARAVFAEINVQLEAKPQKKDSLILVKYYLGLAYTYPAGSKERQVNASRAYTALNLVCAYNSRWKNFDETEKSLLYCALRSCYESLKPLVPETASDAHQDIDQKIEECSPYILRLHTFDAKVGIADRCVRKKDLVNAAKLYNEALQFIQYKKGIEFLLPRADCLLSYARICDPSEKGALSLLAKKVVFQLYDYREALYAVDPSKKTDIIHQVLGCFENLCELFPDPNSVDYKEIQVHIAAWKQKLPSSSHRPPKGRDMVESSSAAPPSSDLSATAPVIAASSSAAPGAATAPYSFGQHLGAAYRLIGENKIEDAKSRFEEMQSQLKTALLSNDSLVPAHIYVGLACTCDEGSAERTANAVKAYDALKVVLENNASWKNLDEVQRSSSYSSLRMCLKEVLALVPKEQTAISEKLTAYIEPCAEYILPLDNCKYKIFEADQYLRQNDRINAAKLFKEALQIIEGKDHIDWLIPRADCLLSYASICDTSEKEDISLRAKTAVFEMYASREALCAGNPSQMTAVLKMLISFLQDLSKLFPNNTSAQHLEIQALIETCRTKLLEEAPASSQLPSSHGRTGKSSSGTSPGEQPAKKVTPGPAGGGSRRMIRIFAVLALAAVAVTVGVVFYRRSFVTVN